MVFRHILKPEIGPSRLRNSKSGGRFFSLNIVETIFGLVITISYASKNEMKVGNLKAFPQKCLLLPTPSLIGNPPLLGGSE